VISEKGRENMKKRLEEQIVQEFPHRCPYCDQVVSYEKIKLKVGENEVECASCKMLYIKVIPGPTGKRKKHRC